MAHQKTDSYFVNKKALITGAGKGVGRATAVRLCELGAEVFALSRTKEDLESLQSVCPTIKTIHVDLCDWEVSRAAVIAIGPVDMLVNNAGVLDKQVSFLETTQEGIRSILEVNFFAAFNIAQVVANGMVQRKTGGVIVNVSSNASKVPDWSVSYATSKSALDMLTMTMAKELGRFKIRTNSVNPGFIKTNMSKEYLSRPGIMEQEMSSSPMGRICELEDVVNTIVYLLSDKSSMVKGQRLIADGGVFLSF